MLLLVELFTIKLQIKYSVNDTHRENLQKQFKTKLYKKKESCLPLMFVTN